MRVSSEHDESLSNITFDTLFLDSQDIESNSFGDWSALSNGNDITNSGSLENWGEMSWQVVMSLFESVVLFDVMKIVSSQNDSSMHFVWQDDTPEQKIYELELLSSELFLIDVFAFYYKYSCLQS